MQAKAQPATPGYLNLAGPSGCTALLSRARFLRNLQRECFIQNVTRQICLLQCALLKMSPKLYRSVGLEPTVWPTYHLGALGCVLTRRHPSISIRDEWLIRLHYVLLICSPASSCHPTSGGLPEGIPAVQSPTTESVSSSATRYVLISCFLFRTAAKWGKRLLVLEFRQGRALCESWPSTSDSTSHISFCIDGLFIIILG
jgi:hypothetical protein